jgi:hypothetical protein
MLDEGGVPAGIFQPVGHPWTFVVEKYCNDLEEQFRVLRHQLFSD